VDGKFEFLITLRSFNPASNFTKLAEPSGVADALRHTPQAGDLPMKYKLLLAAIVLSHLSCTDGGTAPQDRRFNILVKFGVDARNELNTFNDTFTKDLFLDGTATIKLVLSQADFDSIESRMLSIDIFSYPDTFIAQHSDTVGFLIPYQTYVLKVKVDSRWKDLFWEDSIISSDPRGTELREAIEFIRRLVASKPEYKQLPPARGGYL
jgi:hypothetical protein